MEKIKKQIIPVKHKYNLNELNTHINEQKGSDSMPEFLKKHGDEYTATEKAKMIKEHTKAAVATDSLLIGAKAKNIAKTSLEGAGEAIISASPALVHQSVKETIKVFKGEKEASEAVSDVSKMAGSAVKSGAISKVANHEIQHLADLTGSKVSSSILKKTLDANVVGKITGAVLSVKGCTEKYINGDIDANEYTHELLEDSVGFIITVVATASMGPVAGAIVSYALSLAYDAIISEVRAERFSRKNLEKMLETAKLVKEEQQIYREQFNTEFIEFYHGRQESIDTAYDNIIAGIMNNNIDDFIEAINEMGRAFGIEYVMESFEGIDAKMQDEDFVFTI